VIQSQPGFPIWKKTPSQKGLVEALSLSPSMHPPKKKKRKEKKTMLILHDGKYVHVFKNKLGFILNMLFCNHLCSLNSTCVFHVTKDFSRILFNGQYFKVGSRFNVVCPIQTFQSFSNLRQ
jgi:hypothetical protein